uniref:Uncharacterized protein n=1 Tax=viral metagenome TaxID=1070528 RepID=A0A6C0BHM5_9ZZZZ
MASINANGVIIGNPDEIIFVLTKGDVERVYNMTHGPPLGTALPDSVWSVFQQNIYRLDDRLDHAAAIEDILAEYCQVPIATQPVPIASAPPPPPAESIVTGTAPLPVEPPSVPAPDNWEKIRRKEYNTKKFVPPGYGRHVVWSAHRVRAFMVALNLKPTNYDTNLRALAALAGVHPYDFHWKTNPISFGAKRGLSAQKMQQMMGQSYYVMQERFSVKSW